MHVLLPMSRFHTPDAVCCHLAYTWHAEPSCIADHCHTAQTLSSLQINYLAGWAQCAAQQDCAFYGRLVLIQLTLVVVGSMDLMMLGIQKCKAFMATCMQH